MRSSYDGPCQDLRSFWYKDVGLRLPLCMDTNIVAPMADVHDTTTRSFNMSRIKGKDTKPEMLVRRFLHANGFRYRLIVEKLPSKTDIVLPKYKKVI